MKNIFALSALATSALAATVYNVTVGPDYAYDPETISDAVSGDIISFIFGQGHDVVSGSFDNPCQPSGGIYSGDPGNGEIFSVTLNSSDPLWIYCSIPGHCQGGMVMVVNPPSGQTLAGYKSAAASVRGSSQPDSVEGGVFGAVSVASSSAVASSTSAASGVSSVASSISSAASAASSSASASASGNDAAATGLPAAVAVAAGLLALL